MKSLETSKDIETAEEESHSLLPSKAPAKNPSMSVVVGFNLGEFAFAFFGLLASYLTWGVMQELIMDTKFNPTPSVPSGMFPSCMFSVWCFYLLLQPLFVFSRIDSLP